jgi:hypothetical protein
VSDRLAAELYVGSLLVVEDGHSCATRPVIGFEPSVPIEGSRGETHIARGESGSGCECGQINRACAGARSADCIATVNGTGLVLLNVI